MARCASRRSSRSRRSRSPGFPGCQGSYRDDDGAALRVGRWPPGGHPLFREAVYEIMLLTNRSEISFIRNESFRREEAWVQADEDRKKNRYHFNRHTPEYRGQFEAITAEMQSKCPVAWSDTYDGHWVAAGHHEVFELARSAEYLSNEHDVNNERRGYQGITIPSPKDRTVQGGFLGMDPPEQRHYRQARNPSL